MQKILSKKNQRKILLFFVMFIFVSISIFGPLSSVNRTGGIKMVEAKSTSGASNNGSNSSKSTSPKKSTTKSNAFSKEKAPDFNCEPWNLAFAGCGTAISYYVLFMPASGVLWLAGGLFDAMLKFTLNNKNVDTKFVKDTWIVIRDLANLSFIFILLYISIATILNIRDYKKELTYLVIVALLINFSAFFTKIVIDASNIIALEFYNAIKPPDGSISGMFMSAFEPGKILVNNADAGAFLMFFIYAALAVVLIILSYVLFLAGFVLLGRMVAFWFLIIVSPLAFIAFVLPQGKSWAMKWWGHLVNQAFVAPVFLFFMYVIAKMIGGFISGAFPQKSGNDIMDVLLSTVLQASVIIITLFAALKATQSMSGQAGSFAQKFAGGGLAMKYGKKLMGATGLQTGKRFAHFASNKIAGTSFARKHPTLGRFATTGLDKAGGAKYGKYVKEQTKKRTAYGARVLGASEAERKRVIERQKTTLKLQGTSEEKIEAMGFEKKAAEAAEKERTKYAARLETSGRLGKITQRITGQDRINTEVARKLKDNEKGEDSPEEKLMKMIKESVKKEMKEGEKKES